MPFDGFSPDAFAFYTDLEAHNERPWWLDNKHRYDAHVRAPFEALAEELEPVASAVKVYRPYRDVRFAHDKTPYKTRQGLFAQRAPGIGWFLNLDATGVSMGGGFFGDASFTKAYRAAVEAVAAGTELEGIVRELEAAGYELGGERVKTAPRGVDPAHPRIELLRYRFLTARRHLTPEQAGGPELLDALFDTVEHLQPLVQWAVRNVAPKR
ncbi:DUF2461 domain-containing protein [Agrococcus sp. Marseille-Q4369]|uniref:DUF2461 domain-containing protein n=1 Tax=Agrococcus sp. Marseille-Q4369 TaxID=2810513 RepID=UPI001B8BED45|nr:DUF2461 domain-containing protein [Agrococcus sp. Marseille-Q4369]QUW18961.1 DUF2461 domain-containing protein [Agrococcus sp. Marseille-Q4369]